VLFDLKERKGVFLPSNTSHGEEKRGREVKLFRGKGTGKEGGEEYDLPTTTLIIMKIEDHIEGTKKGRNAAIDIFHRKEGEKREKGRGEGEALLFTGTEKEEEGRIFRLT